MEAQRCRLLVAAVEVGGRWSDEAFRFLVELARAKAREVPSILRKGTMQAWLHRWTGMLAFAVHDAFAASLLEEVPAFSIGTDGDVPTLGEVLVTV